MSGLSADAREAFLPDPGPAPRFDTTVDPGLPGVEFVSLNGEWDFSGLENAAAPFPDTTPDWDGIVWKSIAVPLNAFLADPGKRDRARPFVRGYYRRIFHLDAGARRVRLEAGAASHHATVWVNGRRVGGDEGSFTPLVLDLTGALTPGDNEIVIRVTGDLGPRFGAPEAARRVYGALWSPDNIKIGLWQDVRLRLEPELSVAGLLVAPRLADDVLAVDYVVVNPSARPVTVTLDARVSSAMREDGGAENARHRQALTLAPGENRGTFAMPLRAPRRWSPDSPWLYDLVCRFERDGGAVAGAGRTRFGFRDFRAAGGQFFLNGERIYLFGENLPSVHFGGFGKSEAAEEEAMRRWLGGFKSLGCNMVRFAHMPPPTRMYELADELGLMVYDEHGNCFTRTLDEPAFSRNNLRELEKWVARDHNHASVVMWSGGNEIPYLDKPEMVAMLDAQTALIRRLDRQGRPVVSFSGNGTGHFGNARLAGDALDHHTYLGLAIRPWTEWDAELAADTARLARHYDPVPPLIAWELVGFSWGDYRDDTFVPNDIDAYRRFTQKPVTWASPHGIGFAQTIGLAAALDPARGIGYGQRVYGKRLLEMVRQNPEIQGFAPWFQGYRQTHARLWNQPVLPGVRRAGSVIPRNWFAGRPYAVDLFAVNSGGRPVPAAEMRLSLLLENGGGEIPVYRGPTAALAPGGEYRRRIDLALPPECAGFAQLRVRLCDADGAEIGRNFYDLYLAPDRPPAPAAAPDGGVLLWNNDDAASVARTAAMLEHFGMRHATGNVLDGKHKLLIIPAASPAASWPPVRELEAFVRNGGRLLVLEQRPGAVPLLDPVAVTAKRSAFVDLILADHPVFAGLEPRHFDAWDNPDAGLLVTASFQPFTDNAVAAVGTHLGQRDFSVALLEGTLGRGRVFASQLEAVANYATDAAAERYLGNLLRHMAADSTPYAKIRPLVRAGDDDHRVNPDHLRAIDIAAAVNRSTHGDGGWTGQGDNDLRMLPSGVRSYAGVPFTLLDAAANHGRSVMMLRGGERPAYPEAIRGIRLDGKFNRLFFLTACAWGGGKEAGRLRMHYADGGSDDLVLRDGRNTGDWYNQVALPEAKPGFRHAATPARHVGLYVTEWVNPHPARALSHFDFLAVGVDTADIDYMPAAYPVPIVAAVTGERRIGVEPLRIDPSRLKPAASGDGVPPTLRRDDADNAVTVAIAAPTPAGGYSAVKLALADHEAELLRSGAYTWLTFELRATGPGHVDVVLPEREWKNRMAATLDLSTEKDEWRKVRLRLGGDLVSAGEALPAAELRGEVFWYNCNINRRRPRPATVFSLRAIAFE